MEEDVARPFAPSSSLSDDSRPDWLLGIESHFIPHDGARQSKYRFLLDNDV
jgi:hypothetical protein